MTISGARLNQKGPANSHYQMRKVADLSKLTDGIVFVMEYRCPDAQDTKWGLHAANLHALGAMVASIDQLNSDS